MKGQGKETFYFERPGKEFDQHEKLLEELEVDVYFACPSLLVLRDLSELRTGYSVSIS